MTRFKFVDFVKLYHLSASDRISEITDLLEGDYTFYQGIHKKLQVMREIAEEYEYRHFHEFSLAKPDTDKRALMRIIRKHHPARGRKFLVRLNQAGRKMKRVQKPKPTLCYQEYKEEKLPIIETLEMPMEEANNQLAHLSLIQLIEMINAEMKACYSDEINYEEECNNKVVEVAYEDDKEEEVGIDANILSIFEEVQGFANSNGNRHGNMDYYDEEFNKSQIPSKAKAIAGSYHPTEIEKSKYGTRKRKSRK
jgi:hypothetical protein